MMYVCPTIFVCRWMYSGVGQIAIERAGARASGPATERASERAQMDGRIDGRTDAAGPPWSGGGVHPPFRTTAARGIVL